MTLRAHTPPYDGAGPRRIAPTRFTPYTRANLEDIGPIRALPQEERDIMKAVASVLPFRVNDYVVSELIDWDNIPNDPIFQLTFPQSGMLNSHDLERMLDLVRQDAPADQIRQAAGVSNR